MKQDDYFLNQIDILGRLLGKIIADLLQLISKGKIMEGIEVASEVIPVRDSTRHFSYFITSNVP